MFLYKNFDIICLVSSMKNNTIEIHIQNSQDISSFYRKLPFWKRFLNRKTMHLSISPKINSVFKRELESIEHAFNLKDKDERLRYVFEAVSYTHLTLPTIA